MTIEERAALIERENNDPDIRAHKEKLIEEILTKWESMGLVKFKDTEKAENKSSPR